MTVWAQDDGSLVAVAQPKGTMVKYYLSMDKSYFSFLSMLFSVVFYANLLLIVVLFLHSARRVEKAMDPILNGINSMVSGKPVHLREDGELAEISAGLNRAAAYIVQKDNTRGDWIRGISHDIRTPLSVILGYASELEENPALPGRPGIRRRSSAPERKTDRPCGRPEPDHQAGICPAPPGGQAAGPGGAGPAGRQRGAEQRPGRRLHPDLYRGGAGARMTVEGDPALLSRMLANLLHNSVDHNPGGCGIEVMVGPAATGGCVFTVADSGVGGEHGQAAHPQPGCAGGQHPGRRPGKRGRARAGLRIVRQIVRAHHGRLTFAAAAPHGLIVRVWIGGKG